jgi:hypothetical protein
MEEGAFAMFDALGIREIWKTQAPQDVLDKFEEIEARANAYVNGQLGGEGHQNTKRSDNTIARVRVGFISDTIVIGFFMREGQMPHFAVMMAARWAADVTRMAIERPPAWTYRGVVTYGKFAISDRGTYFVGPAVDEAAACHERAHAAVIWLSASARDALKGASFSDFSQGALTTSEHDIPLKDKSNGSVTTARTFAASPFGWNAPPHRCKRMIDALLATFDVSKSDVAAKRQNTMAFLARHLEEHRMLYAALRVWDEPYAHCHGCCGPVVCMICDACAEHCTTEGGPDACWNGFEAWRASLDDPTLASVTRPSPSMVRPAPKPRWPTGR